MMFVNLSRCNHEEYRKTGSTLLFPEHRANCGNDQEEAHDEGEQLDAGRVGHGSVAIVPEVPVEAAALPQDEPQEQDGDRRADGLLEVLHGLEGTAFPGTRDGRSARRCAMRAKSVASRTAAPPGSLLK